MRIFHFVGVILVLSACAELSDDALILDGPASPSYQSDLTACEQLAKQSPTGTAEVGVATAAGAVFGGAVADHEDPDFLPWGVVLGAAAGWIGAVADQDTERRQIVVSCMQGRGHRVVG